MAAWRAGRALVRVELRQLRRNAGRSLLVILLIAVPVAAMVGGSALLKITRVTLEEQRSQVMGRAQISVDGNGPVGIDDVLEQLPEHARREHVFSGHEDVRVPGRKRMARFFALEAGALDAEGLAAGMLWMTAGQQPVRAGEVALSRVLLAGLGVEIGDEVLLSSGPAVITGEVADPEMLDMPILLHAAGATQQRGAHALLIDLPPAEALIFAEQLERVGARVALRSRTGSEDQFEALLVFLCGGFAFFEAALVVAAAFAVGMRRRQREIGLLGSTGAQASGLRTSMAISAALLAGLAGLVGLAVGTGAARALHPYLDGWSQRMTGDFELSIPHVIGALALGLVTSVAAAALPARSATNLPIRVALSGRRPVAQSSRAWLIAGLVLATAGLGLVLIGALAAGRWVGLGLLIGSILVVLGLGCSSPWLLDRLARVAGPLPLAWRLAVRDAGRYRARNGPVVTAVLAGMSISVMLGSLIASVDQLRDTIVPALRDDTLLVEGPAAEEVARALASEHPSLAVAPLQAVYSRGQLVTARWTEVIGEGEPTPRQTWVATGDSELLAVLGAELGRDAHEDGRLLLFFEGEARPGLAFTVADERRLRAPAFEQIVLAQNTRGPQALLHIDQLADLGLQAGPPPGKSLIPWVVRLREPVTATVAERARALAAEVPGSFVDAQIERPQPADVFYEVVLLICIATGLIVVFVATTLSSVESAADARILHTVGAAPSLLRSHLAARAGYLALLGCALSVPAGLMPVYGLHRIATVPLEFVMPWREILITVVAMPAVAYGGTWLVAALSSLGHRATPRQHFTP